MFIEAVLPKVSLGAELRTTGAWSDGFSPLRASRSRTRGRFAHSPHPRRACRYEGPNRDGTNHCDSPPGEARIVGIEMAREIDESRCFDRAKRGAFRFAGVRRSTKRLGS